MTARDLMRRVDARIFNSRIIKDVLIIGSTRISGAFTRAARELVMPGGAVEGVAISFDCQYPSIVGQLEEGAIVTIEGHGRFRFLRELPPGGDHSGLVVLDLGEML